MLKTGEYFVTQVNIEGESYEGYYKLIDDSTSGQEVIVFAGIKSEVAKSAYIVRMRSSIIFLIVIALISAICVSAILLGIVKAIEIAVHNLDKVAEGELNFAVSEKILKRNDEIGTIGQAIHSLIQSIASTISNILHSATELDEFSGKFKDNFTSINNSISNVNIAIEEIANGATNQANETQNVNTQITDMGNAIDATTANIDTLNSSTETMKDHNRQVNNTLDELIKTVTVQKILLTKYINRLMLPTSQQQKLVKQLTSLQTSQARLISFLLMQVLKPQEQENMAEVLL